MYCRLQQPVVTDGVITESSSFIFWVKKYILELQIAICFHYCLLNLSISQLMVYKMLEKLHLKFPKALADILKSFVVCDQQSPKIFSCQLPHIKQKNTENPHILAFLLEKMT